MSEVYTSIKLICNHYIEGTIGYAAAGWDWVVENLSKSEQQEQQQQWHDK